MSQAVLQVENSIELVHPKLKKFWFDLKSNLPEAELFETLRSNERQSFLYEQGRTRSGEIVTYATAGKSPHNHGMAIDVRNINFQTKEKNIRELLSKNQDITWGMDFYTFDSKSKKKVKFPDPAHFQIKNWKMKVPGSGFLSISLIAVIGIAIFKLRGKRK